MNTKIVKINPENIEIEKIKQAAEIIKQGGIVAFPTETVYGLAADFFNTQAVQRIFAVKKRPDDKTLPVQIPDISYLDELGCEVPVLAYQLMSKFWPGPLTLVLKTKEKGTIGVRMPANQIAQRLIKESQTPIVAPSANLSGKPPAKTAEEVLQTFNGLIELVVDGGKTELGVASTVLDLSVSPDRILREGAVSKRALGIDKN